MYLSRVIFIEDHIPIRPDRSLLLGRQTSKWSFWDVVFHENNSTRLCKAQTHFSRVVQRPGFFHQKPSPVGLTGLNWVLMGFMG